MGGTGLSLASERPNAKAAGHHGCDVQPVEDPKTPWRLRICPGYILTPQGDEIWIPTEALFDLSTCLTTSADLPL